jgi:hypothetical protein
VTWRERKHDDSGETSNKRLCTDEDEDIMPLITKEDLADLLSKLRDDDVQEDTSECVNHVHQLLRRFKDERHEKSQHDVEQSHAPPINLLHRDSMPNSIAPNASFPSSKSRSRRPECINNRYCPPRTETHIQPSQVGRRLHALQRAHTTSAKRHDGHHQRAFTTGNGRTAKMIGTGYFMSRACNLKHWTTS